MRVPPVVRTIYRNSDSRIELMQARSPEVSFPRELDLPVLAEIGLRILGLDREEAYRLAWSVDWRSTLLVPVPVNAAAYREVDVAGQQGLLIEKRGVAGGVLTLVGRRSRVRTQRRRADRRVARDGADDTVVTFARCPVAHSPRRSDTLGRDAAP